MAGVKLSIDFKELEKWAKANKVDTARLMKRSFGRAASGLKKQLQKIMREGGGVNGIPKFKDFESFTKELRAANNRKMPLGGILAERDRIVAFRRAGYQIIGWPDGLSQVATAFQEGRGGSESEAFLTDTNSRHKLHRRGIKDIPRAYVHNPRMVLPEPFGAHVRANLEKWAKGAFYKELARQMKKARAA